MRLCYQRDLPRSGVRRIFRSSTTAPFVLGGVCLLAAVVWAVYAATTRDDMFAWLPVLVGVLVAFLCFLAGWSAIQPTNWLMKDTEHGLFISLRSYLNHHLPEDVPTILHLEPTDIRQLIPVTQKTQVPMRDGGMMRTTLSYLDIELNHEGTRELHEILRRERTRDQRREPGRRRLSHDYPLRLAAPNRLRIQWRIQPSAEHAVQYLSDRYTAGEPSRVKLPPLRRMTPESREALIREFWELGERPIAVRMARLHLDASRAAAQGWIDAFDADK
jgi:hypothetical protein